MKFGVNYTPRAGWFHSWLDFDLDEVRRDFDAIATLGVDHVRVFPLWPVFQPNRSLIRPRALEQLSSVVEAAGERGLDVSIDALQGHLSSFDYVPAWLTSWHRTNMFTDEAAIDGTANYVRAIAEIGARHPNYLGTTVGNEVNQFASEPHPEPYRASVDEAGAWLDRMLAAAREGAPGHPAWHSCYDATWYLPEQPFTPQHAGQKGDATLVHSWVFNGVGQHYGPESFETKAHARYLIELSRAFHADPNRKVWLQEVGAPRNVLDAEQVDGFIRDTIAEAQGAPDLYGITWWCSHDVSRSLSDFPELEYELGLFDENGDMKPAGRAFAAAIAEAASATPDTPKTTLDAPAALDRRGELAPGGAFFDQFMAEARSNGYPSIRAI